MRQARYRFFLLPLFFVLACVGAFAQANSEVTGIVTDQTEPPFRERRLRSPIRPLARSTPPPPTTPACMTLSV